MISPARLSWVIVVVSLLRRQLRAEDRHGELDGDERDERDRHGRDGAAKQEPGGGAEHEGEGRVADRRDAAGDEHRRLHPRDAADPLEPPAGVERRVDGRTPPRHDRGQRCGGEHRGQRAEPSFAASQRVRLTLWVQASRWVPASTSRATSGAPQNTPSTAGRATTDADAIP
jgi:hypothetical protein